MFLFWILLKDLLEPFRNFLAITGDFFKTHFQLIN